MHVYCVGSVQGLPGQRLLPLRFCLPAIPLSLPSPICPPLPPLSPPGDIEGFDDARLLACGAALLKGLLDAEAWKSNSLARGYLEHAVGVVSCSIAMLESARHLLAELLHFDADTGSVSARLTGERPGYEPSGQRHREAPAYPLDQEAIIAALCTFDVSARGVICGCS